MPETVEDDSEGSVGSGSDDLESAVPTDGGGAKFGWIRGVLVSIVGLGWAPSALEELGPCTYIRDFDLLGQWGQVGLSKTESRSCHRDQVNLQNVVKCFIALKSTD